MNQYPSSTHNSFEQNINPLLLARLGNMLGKQGLHLCNHIVFYCFGSLCSQVFLDKFEGALFTTNQSDDRARIPIVENKEVFDTIAKYGKMLAELEKADNIPANVLGFDYDHICELLPEAFRLKKEEHPFNENTETLNLSDGNTVISIPCPLSLQRLNVSGYAVVKDVWLKFHSYDLSHSYFSKEDLKELLHFLNRLAVREIIVERLDNTMRGVINGDYPLVHP